MSKKTEAPTEEQKQAHWLSHTPSRSSFWAQASVLKLSKDEVHEALGVESVYDYEGTLDLALAVLVNYAADKAGALEGSEVPEEPQATPNEEGEPEAELEEDLVTAQMMHKYTEAMATMPEAPVLAWTQFQKGPGKPSWTVSLRGGLPPELGDFALQDTMRRIVRCEEWMEKNDYRPVYNGRDVMASAPPQPKPPEAPNGAAPPPPPPGTPPPPPATAPPLENSGQEHQENIDYIKIAATEDGKPIIQFWRSQRKYPELKYNLPAESFFKNVRGTNWFLENGYEQAHFEAVSIGQVYQLPMHVYWVKSPKSPKGKVWKDIVAVVIK